MTIDTDMSLFRRGRPAIESAAPPAPALGTLLCSRNGCGQTTGIRCAYQDRRNHGCDTAWCRSHAVIIGGDVYCRRHAGTVRALEGQQTTAMPDSDNRAASLADWVAKDLAVDVRRVLAAVLSDRADLRLVEDPVRLVLFGSERTRIWQRSWKLTAHVGVAYRVEVCIEEDADDEVVIRVNQKDVIHAVPPWIIARRTGERLSDVEDQERRDRFHTDLMDAVCVGLAKARPLI